MKFHYFIFFIFTLSILGLQGMEHDKWALKKAFTRHKKPNGFDFDRGNSLLLHYNTLLPPSLTLNRDLAIRLTQLGPTIAYTNLKNTLNNAMMKTTRTIIDLPKATIQYYNHYKDPIGYTFNAVTSVSATLLALFFF